MSVVCVSPATRDIDIVDYKNVDLLHVNDVLNAEEVQKYAKHLNPKYIIADHYSLFQIPELEIFCVPLFAANEVLRNKPYTLLNPTTDYVFNFMINKKQASRFLCMKFVEIFELTNYNYTWSGAGEYFDLTKINYELDLLGAQSPLSDYQRWFLGEPILLAPKFKSPHKNQSHDTVSVRHYGGNRWAWEHGGLKELFASSAISLITETGRYDKAAVFTEKTIFSVLGLSLPIWVGGFQQAKHWNAIGFDIFDDVIDHSYQDYPTLVERCYYAFKLNLNLLGDLEKVKELRLRLLPRLENNRKLLLDNILIHHIHQTTSNWPLKLQNYMPEAIQKHFFYLSQKDTCKNL